MTKPWGEKWTAHKDCVIESPSWKTLFVPHEDSRDDEQAARDRAALAAQAPAMARLLLKHRWFVRGASAHCIGCGGRIDWLPRPDEECVSPDCELVAVLRAAGVLP